MLMLNKNLSQKFNPIKKSEFNMFVTYMCLLNLPSLEY